MADGWSGWRRWVGRGRSLPFSERVAQARDLILASRYSVALTGAGISTPSGIPDFRSPQSGLWEQSDPQEVASLEAFRRYPQAFYEWVHPLVATMRNAAPNAAHAALATLEQMGLLRVVITQNIDDLHRRAGSQNVLEVHGSLRTATCLRCYALVESESFVEQFLADGQVPRCPGCGGVLKPDVVLFGEMLPEQTFWQARRAAEECQVMIVAGTSLEVAPAGDLPGLALAHGAHLVIVDRAGTRLDGAADVVFHEDVVMALPAIVAACAGR